ncbi:cbb3-type cytochrome oxidase assembly protein CcoS [Halobacteriovorax marinus]|uniref:cbb3-type cytochrome oxidase assembly protein CcoS n=1 Tax=Halobacteriovorax marinus TaxID=97084 RepID=UPI003A9171B6
MNILYLLVPLALLLGVLFVGAFIWATKKGQFDDLDTPAARIVLDDDLIRNKNITERKGRKE